MAQQVNNDALAQAYKHCISLEQKLRDELKQQNFYHADVRKVRAELRLAYEGLLFCDYAGAQVKSVARFGTSCVIRSFCANRTGKWNPLCGNLSSIARSRSFGAESEQLPQQARKAENLCRRSVLAWLFSVTRQDQVC